MLIGFFGCSLDPNVKKQKYFESGNRYFVQSRYNEALVQFSNAVKLDLRFANAHYQLVRTYIRMQAWSDAYRELQRTIELDPSNVKAQLDVGNLLGAARRFAACFGDQSQLTRFVESSPSPEPDQLASWGMERVVCKQRFVHYGAQTKR